MHKFFRMILLFVLLVFLLSSCSVKEQITYDFSTYLSGNSDFENDAALVLPSKDDLINAEVLYYMYYYNVTLDHIYDSLSDERRMIQLTVKYPDEDFEDAVSSIEQKSEFYYSKAMSSQFYYKDLFYNGFEFHNNDYCACAYNICSDTNTISYIVFACNELSFMNVASSLKYSNIIDSDDILVSREWGEKKHYGFK